MTDHKGHSSFALLKHFWLYLNVLATIDDIREQTGFYVDQHNRVIPHSAFKGQTPGDALRRESGAIEGRK
jgi:hypothetical protein